MKKGVEECRYEQRDYETTQDDPAAPREMQAVDDDTAVGDSSVEMDHLPMPRTVIDQGASPDLGLPDLSGTMPRPASAALRVDRDGPVDWFSMRIERDSSNAKNRELTVEASQSNFFPSCNDFFPLPEATGQKYLDYFYACFHHRWTITHQPSLEMKSHVSLISSSMKMIGAWISGAQDAKWLAVAMHERLTAHVIPQLVWPRNSSACSLH